ncbi:FAD-binding protein [Nonomuraea antimicrobica]
MTEQVDVLIIGSGPAGSTYARTIGDAVPTARILMVEVGPHIPGVRGAHTQNMSEEARVAAQLLTQGPETGVERAKALADIADGLDPSLEFRQTILPGLFFLDPRPKLAEDEVGLSAASMASGVGGMGIHWGTSSPRPHQSERIPFIPADELDAALDHAEQLLGVTKWDVPGTGLAEAIRREMADEFDGPGLTPVGFMPSAIQWKDGQAHFSGTGVILGDLEATVPGFELRAETLAKRVVVEDGVAVGAILEDRGTGDLREVRARHVVVCADGLRTPRCCSRRGSAPPRSGTT